MSEYTVLPPDDPIMVETKESVLQFTTRYLNLQLEQKRIKEDIKVLRQEFEEQGIPTKVVVRAINEHKKIKKNGGHELQEMEMYMGWIAGDTKIDDLFVDLIDKS